jgi:uncharacterized protein (DUF1499 family)
VKLRLGLGIVVLSLLLGCGGVAPGSLAPADLPDPTTLARTGWPNDWLVCPAGMCAAEASAPAPVYAVAPGRLFQAWRDLLEAEPRVTIIGVDESRLLVMAQDRTPLLGFVDTVAIRILPAPDGASTFAVYSRSNIGLGDLGTNRKRVDRWLGLLAVNATDS